MSMHDDLDRARNFYHWWSKRDALALAKYINQISAAPDTAKLTCRDGLSEDGTPVLWFLIEGHDAGTESHDGGFDASHPCPPHCG